MELLESDRRMQKSGKPIFTCCRQQEGKMVINRTHITPLMGGHSLPGNGRIKIGSNKNFGQNKLCLKNWSTNKLCRKKNWGEKKIGSEKSDVGK